MTVGNEVVVAPPDRKPNDLFLAQAFALVDRQFLLMGRLIHSSTAFKEFETAISTGTQGMESVLDVYNYVFGLIDHLVRYQKIVSSIPRLSQKSPEFRALERALLGLKDIRNQLQHINNDIENDKGGPLLGAVCWVSECSQRQYMASFHDIGRKRSSPGIPYDMQNGRHALEFCYVYDERLYNLGRAVAGVREFHEHLKSIVIFEIDGKPYKSGDHFAAMCFEIRDTLQPSASE